MITYLYRGIGIQQHDYDYLPAVFFGKMFIIFYVSRVACFFFMMECVQKFIEKSWVFLNFYEVESFFLYFFNFNLWSLNPQYKTDNSIVSLSNSIYFSTHNNNYNLGLDLDEMLAGIVKTRKVREVIEVLVLFFERKTGYLDKWIEKSRNFAKLCRRNSFLCFVLFFFRKQREFNYALYSPHLWVTLTHFNSNCITFNSHCQLYINIRISSIYVIYFYFSFLFHFIVNCLWLILICIVNTCNKKEANWEQHTMKMSY